MDTVHHPIFSRVLARLSQATLAKTESYRQELLAGLSGRVIEVGAGTGINFAFYPASVTEVVAVEPEPYLRSLAIQAAGTAPAPVTVTDGVAELLPAEDSSFDVGVVSLALCSVRDPARALSELFRVIRPGGKRSSRLGNLLQGVWRLFRPRNSSWIGCRADNNEIVVHDGVALHAPPVRDEFLLVRL